MILRFSKNKNLARWLIVGVCAVQLVDILGSSQVQVRHENFTKADTAKYTGDLKDPRWQELAKNRKHLVYLGDLYESDFVSIAQFAIKNHLTLNTGYFARKPTKSIQDTIDTAKLALTTGDADASTLYVARQPYAVASNLHQINVEGYIVTTK